MAAPPECPPVSRVADRGIALKVHAYAKVNLTLEVLGRRTDGYHEVRTVLQTIDLADTLHVTPGDGIRFHSSDSGLNGPANLVYRAAEALRQETGESRGADIYLEKRIPVGTGLGGGSADAAATLMALSRMWGLGLDNGRLLDIASTLGADVPFLLDGGTALGTGRGDQVAALPPLPPRWMVLACPPDPYPGNPRNPAPKTARLYSMITQCDYTDGNRTAALVASLHAGGDTEALAYNAFERVAPVAFGGLAETWTVLREAAALYAGRQAGPGCPHLSGTGPAIYTFVPGKPEGEDVVSTLKNRGVKAYLVSTINPNPHREGTGP